MPMQNMTHMFGGSIKKSTLVDESIIVFPREDENSPRQAILTKFCPNDLSAFRTCMAANNFSESLCLGPKRLLDTCSAAAFK